MAERLVTPHDFTADYPPERIVGGETEWDVRDRFGGRAGDYPTSDPNRLLQPEYARNANFALHATGGQATSPVIWLDNGAKFHGDVGHAEYATPECLGPRRAALAITAGEIALQEIVTASEKPLWVFARAATIVPANHPINPGDISTKGKHGNYIIPPYIAKREILDPLLTVLATRFYAWGGMVARDDFSLSQKHFDLGEENPLIHSLDRRTAKGNKPMAIIRIHQDEDVNARGGFFRFEDRTEDPTNPWAECISKAIISASLRIPEHPDLEEPQKLLASIQTKNPVQVMKEISKDITLQTVFENTEGKTYTAINAQEVALQALLKLAEEIKFPEDELWAMAQLEKVCTDAQTYVETGDIKPLTDRIGWAAKYDYIRRKTEGSLDYHNTAALQRCLMWDRIAPEGGRQIHYRRAGLQIYSPEEVAKYVHTPPEGTRAALRGEIIRNHTCNTMQWSKLSYINEEGITVMVDLHPYQTEFETAV